MIGQTIGRYHVLEKLGEGGMGAVFKAEDTVLNRPVALKALSGHLAENEEARERFLREAQAASGLNHPNITTVYDLIQEDGQHLICMEYVEGKTLKELATEGPVPTEKALDIVLQTADALEAAHSRGIYHRDVKSANIMVTPEGRVKVMDFGLAYLAERSQLTRSGTTMGTLAYSSPEQITGRPYDSRSEIFSLGAVFYELLTGEVPFRGSTEAEVLYSVINTEPAKVSSVREDTPKTLEAVVERMLAKDPALRYESCAELTTDLTAILGELGVSGGRYAQLLPSTLAARRRAILKRVFRVAAIPAALILLAGILLFPNLLSGPLSSIQWIVVMPVDLPIDLRSEMQEQWVRGIPATVTDNLGPLLSSRKITVYGAQVGEGFRERGLSHIAIGHETQPGTGIVEMELTDWGNRVGLTLRLIDASTGGQSKTESVEQNRPSPESVSGEVSLAIARWFRKRIPIEEEIRFSGIPQFSPEAEREYNLGRGYVQQWSEDSATKALESFRRAIRLEPNMAKAYLGIAETYATTFQTSMVPYSTIRDSMWYYTDRAYEIDKRDPNIRIRRGRLFFYDYEWLQALQEYKNAINLNISSSEALLWYAQDIGYLGREEEALEIVKRAADIDPNNMFIITNLAARYWYAGQNEIVKDIVENSLAIDQTFWVTHWFYGVFLTEQEEYEEAIESFHRAELYIPSSLEWLPDLGYAYAASGQIDSAQAVIQRLKEEARHRYIPAAYFARVYIGLDSLDIAFEYLDQAYLESDPRLIWILAKPNRFHNIRRHSRYQEFIDLLGLADYLP